MSRRSREREKGRRTQAPFLAIPRAILDSPQWAALSAFESRLLIDVAAAYRGSNNGDLSCTWATMKHRGWRSKATLEKSLKGLLNSGFLIQTRQGWRNRCSLYAISWQPINECRGKHDAKPSPVPLNSWATAGRGKILAPPGGETCPSTAGNSKAGTRVLPRQVG